MTGFRDHHREGVAPEDEGTSKVEILGGINSNGKIAKRPQN